MTPTFIMLAHDKWIKHIVGSIELNFGEQGIAMGFMLRAYCNPYDRASVDRLNILGTSNVESWKEPIEECKECIVKFDKEKLNGTLK